MRGGNGFQAGGDTMTGRALLAGSIAIALASTGCVNFILAPRRADLQESVVYGERGPKIVLIDVDGVITEAEEERAFGPDRESSVARVREQLDRAREDSEVKAVLIRIDTPGGSATASELVYREILGFKRERGVPVAAQLMGTATSGGYYVAMAADRVAAHPTTVTGSIGVVFLGIELSGLMGKLGIENQTITAGPHKDAGSPLRPMTAEEREHFQQVLDHLHARFQDVVVTGRPGLDAAAVAAVSDGSIFSAPQALEKGLVDEIGTIEETVDWLEERIGSAETRVVSYHRPREWRRNFYNAAPTGPPAVQLDLGSVLGSLQRPGFHYLWWPGAR
jgi:protease-4